MRSKRWGMFGFVLAGCFVLCSITVVFVYGQLSTIPRGVHFGNFDIAGMTERQLAEKWRETKQIWSEKRWSLSTPEPFAGEIQMTSQALGLAIDDRQLFEPLANLWEGPFWQRAWHRYQLSNTVIPFEVSIEMEKLTAVIATTWPQIEQSSPVDAIRRITSGVQVEYIADLPAYRVDAPQLAEKLTTIANEMGLPAGQRDESFIEIQVPLLSISADVTLEALKAQKIERKIAEFTTTFAAHKHGRVHNIQSTADIVHDMLLAPGETFDFSEVIVKTEKEHGFKPAPVIMNGQFVQGIGGGICQVSSTIYNAALLAGLTIVERQHHSRPVSYVPLGLDATFASGHINFKFQNHARSHLLVLAETSDSQLTVKLFGSLPKEESYRVESKVLETIPAPVKYVQNASLAPGQQKTVTRGTTGYIVETVRIRYINGQEQSREIVAKDHYRPQPTVIAVRKTNPNANLPNERKKPPIIEDGVFGPLF